MNPRADARRASVRRVLAWVLVANLAVIAAKIVIGLRTLSIAVLADAAHSGVDALNNLVALYAVQLAAEPPDDEHPYGHAKFETLGALAIASFLSVACFEVVTGALRRLLADAPPPNVDPLAFQVLAATLVVNAAVAWSETRAGRRLGSELLLADARHTASDVLVTLAVLGGLLLVRLGWPRADAWLALVVAVVIARSGIAILRSTVPVLVDRRALDPERIRSLAARTPGVVEATEIRSRGRPGEAFAELTIRVDARSDVAEAHRIADAVERTLARDGGFSGVVVHVEPAPPEAADASREPPRRADPARE